MLQLQADDGDLTSTDTVTIVCNHVAPTVNAGSDDSITLPSVATLDGTVSDDGYPASPGSVIATWSKVSGPGTVTFGDSSAVDTTASFSEIGTYVLQLQADDGDLTASDSVTISCDHVAPNVAAGSDQSIQLPANATLDGTVSDDGYPASPGSLSLTWTKQSGPGTVTFGDSAAVDTTADFSTDGTYVLRLTADDGDKSTFDELTVTVTPANTAPTANAGSDDSITLPNVASLDGTITDDGYPNPPGAVTVTWSKVSGPGTVTFGDSAAVDTTASFSEIGTYVLQLQASDSALIDTDTVQIVCGHAAPSVNAGTDDSITLPASATLDATVSDDNFPASPGSVTVTWTKTSGPGTVTFGDSAAVDTTAGFSEIGTYVLRLTADDGDKTAYDEVQIVSGHAAPSANAGSDQTSIIVASGATLDGTASDDGYPTSPGSVTTTWSKVSGPGTVTFGDSSAVDTTVDFTTTGTYILQLQASDGDLSDTDTVQIVVSAFMTDNFSDNDITDWSVVSSSGWAASSGQATKVANTGSLAAIEKGGFSVSSGILTLEFDITVSGDWRPGNAGLVDADGDGIYLQCYVGDTYVEIGGYETTDNALTKGSGSYVDATCDPSAGVTIKYEVNLSTGEVKGYVDGTLEHTNTVSLTGVGAITDVVFQAKKNWYLDNVVLD